MTAEGLPLLDVFRRLQEAGLPLGAGEYMLVLRALEEGFGLPDRAALRRLCRLLWAKTPEEARLVGECLDGALGPTPEGAAPDGTGAGGAPGAAEGGGAAAAPVVGEAAVGQALRQGVAADDDVPYGLPMTADDYLPLGRRQMKQAWRHLRRPIRRGPPVELDVDETIRRHERQGGLFLPVLRPRRTNLVQLTLLIDQEGSMVPFYPLTRRLCETASGGRLGGLRLYYFHNSPLEHLYTDSALVAAEPLGDVLGKAGARHAGVLIFSDAGAARGRLCPERVDATAAFLSACQQRVRQLAWLNPVPRRRWHGTSAAVISQFVPMFEISRRGFDDAVGALRGRHRAGPGAW